MVHFKQCNFCQELCCVEDHSYLTIFLHKSAETDSSLCICDSCFKIVRPHLIPDLANYTYPIFLLKEDEKSDLKIEKKFDSVKEFHQATKDLDTSESSSYYYTVSNKTNGIPNIDESMHISEWSQDTHYNPWAVLDARVNMDIFSLIERLPQFTISEEGRTLLCEKIKSHIEGLKRNLECCEETLSKKIRFSED